MGQPDTKPLYLGKNIGAGIKSSPNVGGIEEILSL